MTAKIKSSKSIDNPQVIGEHIRKRRLELGLFQADLVKIFNVCEDSITGWETGRSIPQIQYYPKITKFLGYNPFACETQTLGGRIQKFRFERGLSHKKLGKIMGVDASTISGWESNEHVPNALKRTLLEKIINQKEFSI